MSRWRPTPRRYSRAEGAPTSVARRWLTPPPPRDPFENLISLVAGPIAAVIRSFDQLRRGSDELFKGLENFNRTMANLNDTAERVNACSTSSRGRCGR